MENHVLHAASSSNNAYSGQDNYRDNYAHRDHDPYKNNNDPYQNDDAHKKKEREEKKGPWSLDFELLRFFRENFNSGVDFEESPRAFFDEEHLLAIRLKILGRNFSTILFKFIFMIIFSIGALALSGKALYIFGGIYLIMFLYFIVVPIAFVKYSRQYLVDTTDRGKLIKVHNTYTKWIRPLEVIAMNFFTIIFVLFEIILLLNIDLIIEKTKQYTENIDNETLHNFIDSINPVDIQHSILVSIGFYIAAYILYWIFIYKIWSPKWEKKRLENTDAYKKTNQRAAQNLKDALLGDL